LCRCDSVEAIRWGRSLGIRLFQGHYIELAPARCSPTRNRHPARQALRTHAAS
jgi:hypothetical protein